MKFSKMSGNGNDFILIDNRLGVADGIVDVNFVKKVCSRGLSIGADGVILIEKSEGLDFKWVFYNSDGTNADMCGNGARCAARFAYIKGIAPKQMAFLTGAGVIEGYITTGVDVKVLLTKPHSLHICDVSFVNTGVPHAVVVSENIESVDVDKCGRQIRYSDEFKPSGTNVNFISRLANNKIRVRTYERGVEGETLACGTGSVASAIVAVKKGIVESPVEVLTSSGKILKVYIDGEKIYLEGEARLIYNGDLNVEAYRY